MTVRHKSGSPVAIPHYFLYGESTRDVDQRFLHIETLDSRSRQHDWSIKPHVHTELHHLLYIENGTGGFDSDARTFGIASPMLVNVPAQCVHAFRFNPGTEGLIITASSTLLRRVSIEHTQFESILNNTMVLMLSDQESKLFREKFSALAMEFCGERVAFRAAVESIFLSILVEAVRIKLVADTRNTLLHDADVDLVQRYKELIEKHFRSRMNTMEYASRLFVCGERLRIACLRVAAVSPLVMLNARRLLEAKRYLLYSNMSIAEVGYQSGFQDSAYFSRFFARSTGKTPRNYRIIHSG